MNIINNGEILYKIAEVEANKKYKISFELEGQLQFQIGVQKSNSMIKKSVTKKMPGVTGTYTYTFTPQYNGEVYIEETYRPYFNAWTAINNIVIEEV